MVLGIQIFALAFSAFMLYLSFLYYKKEEFTMNEWLFWSAFASVFAFFSLFPTALDPLVRSLKVGRTLDLFIILGFMFMTATIFYVYRITKRSNKKIEELVRKIAMEKGENEK